MQMGQRPRHASSPQGVALPLARLRNITMTTNATREQRIRPTARPTTEKVVDGPSGAKAAAPVLADVVGTMAGSNTADAA